MNNCKFCGLPIRFDASGPKIVPRNEDGRDHRETCLGFSSNYRHDVRNRNHENVVREFLNGKGDKYRP